MKRLNFAIGVIVIGVMNLCVKNGSEEAEIREKLGKVGKGRESESMMRGYSRGEAATSLY